METLLAILNILALGGVAVAVFLLREYLPAYATKKGENLATKEDIGEIAVIVERIKTANATEIERLRATWSGSGQNVALPRSGSVTSIASSLN